MKKYIYKDIILEKEFSFFEIKDTLRGFVDFNYASLPIEIKYNIKNNILYGDLIARQDLKGYYPCIGYNSVKNINGIPVSGRILTIGFTKTPNDDLSIPVIKEYNSIIK